MSPKGEMTGPELVRECIAVSGLRSVNQFAYQIMAGRNGRTVRRWLAGETMPQPVTDWLQEWLAARKVPNA